MTASKFTTLTVSCITGNINKAKRLVEEYQYKRGYYYNNGSGTIRKIIRGSSYIHNILEKANISDGLPCYKCKKFIPPGSDCWVKYRHNNYVTIPCYYCCSCWESLFY